MYNDLQTIRPSGPIDGQLPRHANMPDIEKLVTGGWGYSQAEAIIINNPKSGTEEMFDGIAVQTFMAGLRNSLEFSKAADGHAYALLMQKAASNNLVKADDGQYYDHMVMDILATREEDGEAVLAVFMSGQKDFTQLMRELEGKVILLQREFWFNISSFLEHNWFLTMKREQQEFAAAQEAAEKEEAEEKAAQAAEEKAAEAAQAE